jgi:hypothetical protein
MAVMKLCFLVLLSKKDLDSVGTAIYSFNYAINDGLMERRYAVGGLKVNL